MYGGQRAACLSAFRPPSLVAATQQDIQRFPETGIMSQIERYGLTSRVRYLIEPGEWLVGSSAFDGLEKRQRLATIILKPHFALPRFQAAVIATAWLLPDRARHARASLHRQSVQRSVPQSATHLLTVPEEGRQRDGP